MGDRTITEVDGPADRGLGGKDEEHLEETQTKLVRVWLAEKWRGDNGSIPGLCARGWVANAAIHPSRPSMTHHGCDE